MKDVQEHGECQAGEDGRRMLNEPCIWIVERAVEAQQAHFKASKMTTTQYTSGSNSRLKGLKRELTSAGSRSVVLTDRLKELLASLGEGANWRGQAEPGATGEAEMKSSGTDNPADPEMKSLGVDVPTIGDPKIDKPGAKK